MREGLIVVQVALSVVLLGASGLLVRSFFMLHRGPGFDPDLVVMVRLRPSLVGFTNDRAWAFQREVIRRLEALPGIARRKSGERSAVARLDRPADVRCGSPGPRRSVGGASGGDDRCGPSLLQDARRRASSRAASSTTATRDGPRVAVVNETLARRLWPKGGDGGPLVIVGPDRCEVVGVVKDLQWVSALEQPEPIAYLNFWQQDRTNAGRRIRGRTSGWPATRRPCCPRSARDRRGRSRRAYRGRRVARREPRLSLRRRARRADDARDVWRAHARAEHDRVVCGARVRGRAADA